MGQKIIIIIMVVVVKNRNLEYCRFLYGTAGDKSKIVMWLCCPSLAIYHTSYYAMPFIACGRVPVYNSRVTAAVHITWFYTRISTKRHVYTPNCAALCGVREIIHMTKRSRQRSNGFRNALVNRLNIW